MLFIKSKKAGSIGAFMYTVKKNPLHLQEKLLAAMVLAIFMVKYAVTLFSAVFVVHLTVFLQCKSPEDSCILRQAIGNIVS